jgi:hypothetical protein
VAGNALRQARCFPDEVRRLLNATICAGVKISAAPAPSEGYALVGYGIGRDTVRLAGPGDINPVAVAKAKLAAVKPESIVRLAGRILCRAGLLNRLVSFSVVVSMRKLAIDPDTHRSGLVSHGYTNRVIRYAFGTLRGDGSGTRDEGGKRGGRDGR